MSDPNLQTRWASLLIDSLVEAGIRHAVVSPGSRSTPVTLAAIRNDKLTVHSIIDERSAAFFALGMAKTSGSPGLLICTSGTAGAHYYPAVIEAGHSFTPLVALTADRPPELHDNGGAQTSCQIRLFGEHARHYFELGLPDDDEDALRALRRKAAQAVFASTWPTPGAVQINAWFRKPLEPAPPADGGASVLDGRVEKIVREPLTVPHPPRSEPDRAAIDEVAKLCRRATRGLIVCGPAPVANGAARAAIHELAETLRYPLLAEGASQVRFTGVPHPLRCDGFDLFLRSDSFRKEHRPDLILRFGAAPTSKGWDHFLRENESCVRIVIGPHGWGDPRNSADRILFASTRAAASRIRESFAGAGRSHQTRWAEDFAAADGATWRAVEEDARSGNGPLTKSALARTLLAALPARSLFAVGNSLPIREVDSFCTGGLADVAVWSQKGVNGIDGLISGAAGAATVRGGPVTLYLGDVSLLHDLTGLMAARRVRTPFVIVVAQNDGGRIFEQLPIAGCPGVDDNTLSYWTTPHGLDLSRAAGLFGIAYGKTRTADELRSALDQAYRAGGCTLIEAPVPASGAAEEHGRVAAAVDHALSKRAGSRR